VDELRKNENIQVCPRCQSEDWLAVDYPMELFLPILISIFNNVLGKGDNGELLAELLERIEGKRYFELKKEAEKNEQ
jgi:hypothetical protein